MLVLLPTMENKLTAQWQGPYKVLKLIGKVNYCVDMHDRRKRRRVFHVNMLRKWHAPSAVGYWAQELERERDETGEADDVPFWNEGADDGTSDAATLGEQLSVQQKQDLQDLMDANAGVFRNQPGRTTMAEHHIHSGTAHPVRLPPYRLPYAHRDNVKKELAEMLESGIIEPSVSEWSAPIVLVKKRDHTLRLCVDYRRLNSLSKADAYPMPRIDELLDRLGKAKFISTLDLTRGYWQVPLSEEAKEKSAFATPFGLFQFNVMPFGLQGAPATFQRLMDRLIQGLNGYSAAYLDDLVVYSETWEEHLEHLRTILQRIREAGLTVKKKKCQLGMSHCLYLGHVVGGGTVKLEQSKVEAVWQWKAPRTKKQVRSFLGLTGYYRRFIPNYATIAAPLMDLTKKTAPNQVNWTTSCEEAFQELKRLLCSYPILCAPDFDKPFVLQTDASDRGIGAVLSQSDADGLDHPIAYFSKKFLPREQKYATVEKECLAIKTGIEAFRIYLAGRPFTVQTDHQSLVWLDRLKENNPHLTRWSLALQPYQFVVVHRTGKSNGNADTLSRFATN